MSRIEIDGLQKFESMQAKARAFHARGVSGIMGLAKLLPDPLEGEEEEEITNPVIDGLAAAYNKVMKYNGELVVFNQGCFADSIASGRNVKLCVDHNMDIVLADKHNGFSVFETEYGVTLRCNVQDSKNPYAVLGLVASENRRGVSVQCNILSSEVHKCGDADVRFITRAELNECSLVRLGLNEPAFAYITDRRNPAPTANVRSASFSKHQAAYLAKRNGESTAHTESAETYGGYTTAQWAALASRLDAIEDRILSARLDAIEAHLGLVPESNHKASIAAILRGEHDAHYMSLVGCRMDNV